MPRKHDTELPGAQALRQMAAQSDSRALFSDRQPDPAFRSINVITYKSRKMKAI